MAQLSSQESMVSNTSESGAVGRLAGFGSIFGIIAAALGLITGVSLVPIPSLVWETTSISPFVWTLGGSTQFPLLMASFMGLMAVSLLLQVRGSRDLNRKLGNNLSSIGWVGFFLALAIAIYVSTQFVGVLGPSLIPNFLSDPSNSLVN